MLLRVFVLIGFILSLGLAMPAVAVDYTVRNLAVDVEAETAIKAREEALAQARKNAFNILKKRLPGMMADGPTPDADAIAAMVDSFEINREKLSKNRYLASVNVTFNERAVQMYMNRSMGYAGFEGGSQGNAFNRLLGEAATGQTRNMPETVRTMEHHRTAYNSSRAESESMVSIPIAGIRQWIGIKKSLETISTVRDVEIREISARRAVVNLRHAGSIYDLQNALMGRGMRLYANTGVMRDAAPYVLVTRG